MCNCLFSFLSRHSCPKPVQPKTDLFHTTGDVKLSQTEYRTIFLNHGSAKPRESLKPPQRVTTRDAPMSSHTTNRVDFISHQVSPYTPRPPTVYKKPEGTVSGESEYSKEFRSKTPEPVKPVLPQPSQVRTLDEKFHGKSTQATDFVCYELPPREFYGERRVYEPPTETFSGLSTFQTDFKGLLQTEPARSMKPQQNPKTSNERFNGTTCYHVDFRRFEIPEKFQHPKQVYKPPEELFQGYSTFTTDFPGHHGIKPAQSLKPPINAKVSHAPLDSLTTSRQSYRKWEMPPRFSRPPTVYEPPKEKFYSKTVFSDDFVSYGVPEPVSNFKPKHEPIKKIAPIEHETVNRIDYKPPDITQRTQLIIQEKKYEPPTEKFEALSTTSTAYRGQYAPPAPSAKPLLKPYSKGIKFDAHSMYRECYSQSGFKPDYITGHPNKPVIPGYMFSHEDPKSGHKFYIPETKPTTPPSQPLVS